MKKQEKNTNEATNVGLQAIFSPFLIPTITSVANKVIWNTNDPWKK